MTEQLIGIATHPAFWAVAGILIKTFAPAWVPVLGFGKKLIIELTELHDESKVDNEAIKKHAEITGKNLAVSHLLNRLK